MKKELYFWVFLFMFVITPVCAKINAGASENVSDEKSLKTAEVDENNKDKEKAVIKDEEKNVSEKIKSPENEQEEKVEKSRLQRRREELAVERAMEASRFKKKAEFAGGVILILLGLKILLEHLGVI